MNSIVLDIHRGRFEAMERLYKKDSGKAFREMEAITDLMKRDIPEQYHELLNQYENTMMKLVDETCEMDFMAGYQLGMRLLIAVWPAEG